MKNLCALHSIVALLIVCNFAHAEITIVEYNSSTNKFYMAKVISKAPIIEKVPYMATKNYCERYFTYYTILYLEMENQYDRTQEEMLVYECMKELYDIPENHHFLINYMASLCI